MPHKSLPDLESLRSSAFLDSDGKLRLEEILGRREAYFDPEARDDVWILLQWLAIAVATLEAIDHTMDELAEILEAAK